MRQVAKVRSESAEDNAGSAYLPPSARVAPPGALLQNTLEQVLIPRTLEFGARDSASERALTAEPAQSISA